MKKLKIAQVVSLSESVPPTSQNGLEFVVSWLTEELVRRGHDVTLFAPGDSKTSAKLVSLLPKALPRHSQTSWERYFFSIWNTIVACSDRQFDVIHCHNMNGAYIANLTNSQVVETIHSPYDPSFEKFFLSDPETAKSMSPILKSMQKVNFVAISKYQENEHMSSTNSYFKNHSVIHNGISVEKFDFNDNPKDYFLYIGYINKNKGADVAVKIAHEQGLKLKIAGSHLYEEKFFEEKIKPYLSDKIEYLGAVNFQEKNELYKNALATLAPLSWHEPFGLTIVESQACGTPVIAFRKGAAPEIIKHGETGFVVETEEQMIEAIGSINTINRESCRKWVEKNFSVKKMVDEYEKFYASLIT